MTTETILTDAEIITIGHQARGIEPGENGYILPVTFARAIEQAVLAKLAEQEPVAYAAFSNNGNIRLWSTLPQIVGGEVDLYPLYAHPMPNCQGFLDNSNHIVDARKKVKENHIVEANKMVDGADEALRKELDLVGLDMGAYSSPKEAIAALIDWHVSVATDPRTNGGWQLVPVEPTEEMRANLLGWSLGLNLHDAAGDKYKAMLAAAPKHTGENT